MRRIGSLRLHKQFPRVWLIWGPGFAFQAYFYPCVSFGIHFDASRLLLDVHFLFFTLAIGKRAHITNKEDRTRHSSRGFMFETDPKAWL
jgi:hypothetical protein